MIITSQPSAACLIVSHVASLHATWSRAALQAFLALLPADVAVALPPDVRAAIAAGNFARAVTALHAHLGLDEQARVPARLGAAVLQSPLRAYHAHLTAHSGHRRVGALERRIEGRWLSL